MHYSNLLCQVQKHALTWLSTQSVGSTMIVWRANLSWSTSPVLCLFLWCTEHFQHDCVTERNTGVTHKSMLQFNICSQAEVGICKSRALKWHTVPLAVSQQKQSGFNFPLKTKIIFTLSLSELLMAPGTNSGNIYEWCGPCSRPPHWGYLTDILLRTLSNCSQLNSSQARCYLQF